MFEDISEKEPERRPQEQRNHLSQDYCKNHPLISANWRCTECGTGFCEDCVLYKGSKKLTFTRIAVCPECKGRCKDFKFEDEKAHQIREARKKNKRNTVIRYTVFSIFLTLLLIFPNDITFFCFIVFSFWLGPLRNIDLIYKLGATVILGWVNNPALTFMDNELWMLKFRDIPDLFVYYRKYFIESIIVLLAFFIVELASEGVSGIYYNKSQIVSDKLGIRGWSLGILGILMIIFSIIFLYINLLSK
ncbi:MAG: hypothetical protein WA126_06915 [Thermodesulfovibrionales bacterium]